MLASFVAVPREGYFEQVHHVFGHVNKYHNTELVFDPSSPGIDANAFERQYWTTSEFGNLLEEDPKPRKTIEST